MAPVDWKKSGPLDRGEHLATRTRSDINTALARESDRGCILIAAAWLDEILSLILRAHFVDDPKNSDALLSGPNAPAGTFSSRIRLSYALGLIREVDFRTLQQIRAIRNDCAHLPTTGQVEVSFAAEPLASRSMSLPLPPNIPLTELQNNTPKSRFIAVAAFLFGILIGIYDHQVHCVPFGKIPTEKQKT